MALVIDTQYRDTFGYEDWTIFVSRVGSGKYRGQLTVAGSDGNPFMMWDSYYYNNYADFDSAEECYEYLRQQAESFGSEGTTERSERAIAAGK